LASVVASAAAVPGYGKLLESQWLEVTEKEVPIGRLGGPARILHLSDLHAGDDTPFETLERAIDLGLREQPDVVCLTGDYISRGHLPDMDRYQDVLRRLTRQIPTFASFGNHDGGLWSAQAGGLSDVDSIHRHFEAAGVMCLHNDAALATTPGGRLNMVGIGDLWANDVAPPAAFAKLKDRDRPTVVLSHNPDTTKVLDAYPADLQLSGHTHGGQVVVPILGAAPFAPVSDRRFIAGLYRHRDRYVHVTRGVGSIMGIRFACRPEVSVLQLVPA
jgi:predicted MPP superfamily phosphohydrolase